MLPTKERYNRSNGTSAGAPAPDELPVLLVVVFVANVGVNVRLSAVSPACNAAKRLVFA